jgi:tRNA-splicing ligase RtcB
MNSRQLQKLGVSEDCVKSAIAAIQTATKSGGMKGKRIKQVIKDVLERPQDFTADEHFGPFAQAVIADREFVRPETISYRTWGSEIDEASHAQMRQACSVPMAAGAALMPDAHVGYGLPIGGVLALENAVIPYGVGVDIACRMKLSVLDLPPKSLDDEFNRFKDAIEGGTRFGIGSTHEKPQDHAVMDQDWSITRITREKKDLAWSQLGTSGSGNHFVDVGVLSLLERDEDLGLDAGQYVAVMSHSGSRGPGAAVCHTYSGIARGQLPAKYEDLAYLSWLSLDSEAGQEYWAAMNLMGDYAAANHDVIHRLVTKLLGARILAAVENQKSCENKPIWLRSLPASIPES